MPQSLDMTGETAGQLTVLGLSPWTRHHKRYVCRCTCGTKISVSQNQLRNGKTKSCGCLRRHITAELGRSAKKHGLTNGPEFQAWNQARLRCSPKCRPHHFSRYYGRGIRMCEEWRTSFQAFIDHIGLRPGPEYSLDRINNDGHYEPGNVRWATRSEQAKNRAARQRNELGQFN